MRARFLGCSTLLALACLPAAARGESTSTKPSYAALPSGHVAPPPTKKPFAVGGGERVAGIAQFGVEGNPGVTEVYASAEERKAFRAGEMTRLGGCFSEQSRGTVDDDDAWDFGEPRLGLWGDGSGPAVHAVHAETLVEEGDTARLEIVDAWLSTTTRGVRKIAKTTLPLVRIATAASDVHVYAAKDESAAGNRVQFVVSRPAPPDTAPFVVERPADQAMVGRGGCGHVRIPLRSDVPGGESAVVRTTVALGGHGDGTPGNDVDSGRDDPGEVRARELEVQLGVSKTSRDPAPVFTVSFGWAGREQVLRVSPATGRFMGKRRK